MGLRATNASPSPNAMNFINVYPPARTAEVGPIGSYQKTGYVACGRRRNSVGVMRITFRIARVRGIATPPTWSVNAKNTRNDGRGLNPILHPGQNSVQHVPHFRQPLLLCRDRLRVLHGGLQPGNQRGPKHLHKNGHELTPLFL